MYKNTSWVHSILPFNTWIARQLAKSILVQGYWKVDLQMVITNSKIKLQQIIFFHEKKTNTAYWNCDLGFLGLLLASSSGAFVSLAWRSRVKTPTLEPFILFFVHVIFDKWMILKFFFFYKYFKIYSHVNYVRYIYAWLNIIYYFILNII